MTGASTWNTDPKARAVLEKQSKMQPSSPFPSRPVEPLGAGDAGRYLIMNYRNSKIISLLIVLLLIILVCNGCERSLTITKQYNLKNYHISDFTFDIWSYGNWIAKESSNQCINSYEPPYTLLLAIRTNKQGWKKIKVVSAYIIYKDVVTDIMPTLQNDIDYIKKRPTSAIEEPYSVFQFENAIKFNGQFSIHIELKEQIKNTDSLKFALQVPYTENSQKGFLFWDALMGI